MKGYDLIIVTSNPYPNGLASTNRIATYAKEIAQFCNVLLLSFADSPFVAGGDKYHKGCIDKVDYIYLRPADPKNKTVLTKIAYRVITVLRLLYFLLIKYSPRSIICYFDSIFYTRCIYFISKLRKCHIYRDVTETFEVYFGSEKNRNRQKNIQRLYDGLIVMTEGIRDYFVGINNNTFVLPMGVDVSRFDNISSRDEKYFFYCSGGVLERDGVIDSLKGFLAFHKQYPEYTFRMATPIDNNDDYHNSVMKLVKENPCIEYLGVVDSKNIPILMSKSTGLVVTPHHDYITKGFPTKLGEYMASRKPVVCTSIATLKDNIPEDCCYMASPNNIEEIANAMKRIIENPLEASRIAQNGYNYVIKNYTVRPYLNDLLIFLQLA